MTEVEIVLHRIPTADSRPYLVALGPDGNLWLCENGASRIGRLNPHDGTFAEFATPTAQSRPVGIAAGRVRDDSEHSPGTLCQLRRLVHSQDPNEQFLRGHLVARRSSVHAGAG